VSSPNTDICKGWLPNVFFENNKLFKSQPISNQTTRPYKNRHAPKKPIKIVNNFLGVVIFIGNYTIGDLELIRK